ncbi:M20 family metallopeptidase [Arthrobacter sp. H14-L1]|uniref:M20 family metallopeptidase n=1 Tax=Arthrobacter sp. H14-L1 TaxID=2996697 RepID=UPI00227050CA|nr:M20/M25/M40 family metallo-hydrolase [Arthrobacter sp. H14-L1]MCY0906571.1 M20/M25/M40 family metallo-hydrolase [Arthrobacter sp. H14-L1]
MNKTETREFLQDLIRIPSDSRDTTAQRGIQKTITAMLISREPLLAVTCQSEVKHPWTLIRSPQSSGNMLIFACHVDTVPIGDESDWTHPPFAAVIANGRIHGRGSVDMKGGIAVAAAALLTAAKLGRNVGLLLTSDEEVGSLGASGAATSLVGQEVGAVIIPEATENKVILGHRGAMWLRLRSVGLAAHGSTPERGVNAAQKIFKALERAIDELPLTSNAQLGKESWNLGILESGTAPNIVPELAHATIDMRTVTDGLALRDWWERQPEIDHVETLLELPPLRTEVSAWTDSLPAAVTSTPAPYFTDGSIISKSLPGVPVIIWGPGEPAQMHARDESLGIDSLDEAYDHFQHVVISCDAL